MECNTCHLRISGRCPYQHVPDEKLTQRCPLLRQSFQDNVLNLITLHRPGEPLPSSKFPKWLTEKKEHKEMDYSRDDTKEIVNGMRPFNN